MKCKICGKRANSLKAMGAHYRKKHPNRMKAKKKASKPKSRSRAVSGMNYCPVCGKEI